MIIEDRDYQVKIEKDVFDFFDKHGGNRKRNPVVDACVGAGKSVVIAKIIKRIISQWPDQKIIMLVHSRELVQQNYDKLKAIAPDLDIGVYSAGLGRKEHGHQITFASIQSVHKKAYSHIGFKDLIFIDEVHAISKQASKGMYRTFIDDMKLINKNLRFIGFTGTPYRLNGGSIIKGKERLFTDICTSITIRELLDMGYLSPLINAPVDRVDTSDLRITAGDFNIKDIASLMDDSSLITDTVNEIVKHGHDRKSWLIFCSSIEHANHVKDEILKHGITCETVNGKTKKSERDQILNDFKSGKIKAVTNVGVLTTGFDHPATDLIALLRPTASPGLFVQMLGRGLRTADGKDNCLFLDFTDTTERLGPIDNVKPPREKDGTTVTAGQPLKECPNCQEPLPISVSECEFCGYQYPPLPPTHDSVISNASILSGGFVSSEVEYEITEIRYVKHKKIGKPDSLRVDYYCGIKKICSEWVCVEHTGYAKEKANKWVYSRGFEEEFNSVDDMLENHFLFEQPSKIIVNESGKYPEIKRVIF